MRSATISNVIGLLSLALLVLSVVPTASVAVGLDHVASNEVCAESRSGDAFLFADQNEHHHANCFGLMAHCLITSTTPVTLSAPRSEPSSGAPKVESLQLAESRVLEVKSPPPRF